MATISALNIGNTKYDIDATTLGGKDASSYLTAHQSLDNYATTASVSTLQGYFTDGVAKSASSAAAADKLKTARNIAATGDVTWSVSFDGAAAKTGAATINNVPSAVSWSGVSAAVDNVIGDKIAGVYKVKGTKTVAQINGISDMKVGDVYNVSDSGTITAGGKSFTVLAGDNIVYTSASTSDKGWDKLAATIDLSPYQTIDGMTAYVAKSDSTYKNTTAYASDYNTNKSKFLTAHQSLDAYQTTAGMTAYVPSGRKVNGKALSADVTIGISDISSLSTYTGYAKDWNDNKATVTGNASSGAAASAAIKAASTAWSADQANQNAYASITVFTAVNKGVTTNATAVQDAFALSAWGSDVALTAVSDTNGHPVIGISAKNTTYNAATTANVGLTKASYVQDGVAYIF